MLVNTVSDSQYRELLDVAKKIDAVNFMDIAHDALIEYKNFDDARKKLKSISYGYKPKDFLDVSKHEITDKVCVACNNVYPVAMFYLSNHSPNGRTYLRADCKYCCCNRAKKYWKIRDKEKYNKRRRELYAARRSAKLKA